MRNPLWKSKCWSSLWVRWACSRETQREEPRTRCISGKASKADGKGLVNLSAQEADPQGQYNTETHKADSQKRESIPSQAFQFAG